MVALYLGFAIFKILKRRPKNVFEGDYWDFLLGKSQSTERTCYRYHCLTGIELSEFPLKEFKSCAELVSSALSI
jgi:hypothetical protein